MKDIKKLKVIYNNRTVGYLANNDNQIVFQYDLDWQKDGFSISPLTLPLNNNLYISDSNNFEGLFGVFYDSLPDGWGRLLINRKMQQEGINYESLSPLVKLSLIGEYGLGGLQYKPVQYDKEDIKEYDLDYLANVASKVYDDKKSDLDSIYKCGGSSGGARPKVHIKYGRQEWIIKFPCSNDPKDIGVKEYEANDLAAKCGINVAEYKLFKSNVCKGYFGSKRFDRKGNKRLHTISLSSILETTHTIPNLDYSHFFQVIEKICVNHDDLLMGYKMMCFNVLYGNKDDHGKNFSFIYDNGYHLAPFYDVTYTPHKLEHEMTVLGNGNPSEEDLINIGMKFRISKDTCLKIIYNTKEIIRSNT